MKYFNSETLKGISKYAYGCMRISKVPFAEADRLVKTCLSGGINFFDHADIYGGDGECEEIFGRILKSVKRDSVFIQSKCGIVRGMGYDSSAQHITESVDGILKRLDTEYLDSLLIHRPDALVEPEEVAEAFDKLYAAGKVRAFGVSNHNSMQIELLKSRSGRKLEFNQLQFGLGFTGMIDEGVNVNMKNDGSIMHDGSLISYMRLNGMTMQAWSPLQYGFFEGCIIGSERYAELNAKLGQLGEKYGVSAGAIAIAWIGRHPMKNQTIIGTTNADRLTDMISGSDVELTKREWYELYKAAGNKLP